MSIVTGWRAEKAVINDVPVYTFIGGGFGFVEMTWQQVLDDAHSVALQEDRGRDWVARELGDVPSRFVHGYQTMDDFTTVQQGVDLGCAHIGDTNTLLIPGEYLP